MLDYLKTLAWLDAALFFLLENLIVMALALLLGYGLKLLFRHRGRLVHTSQHISHQEWVVASATLLINTLITLLGFLLWQGGVIKIYTGFAPRMILDFIVLFMGMDFLMYIFHFLVHKTFLYALIHRLHHQYREPQPIDLFVLHPFETVAFGTLWLGLMIIYPAHFSAVVIYLTANVLFGVLGHSGWEPFPQSWKQQPFLKYIGSSTFHFQHHQHEGYNFGFYTSVWDRLFGTLAPEYPEQERA